MSEQRHVGLFDIHGPHEVILEPSLKEIQKFDPTHLIYGGDTANLEFASHWNEPIFKELGSGAIRDKLAEEIEYVKKMLATICSAVKSTCRKIWIPGNHEAWLYWIALYRPDLGGGFPKLTLHKDITFKSDLSLKQNKAVKMILESLFETKRLGIEVLQYNEPLELNGLTYLHGHQLGNDSLKQFPTKNVVHGHYHRHTVKPGFNSGAPGKPIKHISVPTMGRLNPWFLRNRSSQWENGYWEAVAESASIWDGRVRRVMNNGRKILS